MPNCTYHTSGQMAYKHKQWVFSRPFCRPCQGVWCNWSRSSSTEVTPILWTIKWHSWVCLLTSISSAAAGLCKQFQMLLTSLGIWCATRFSVGPTCLLSAHKGLTFIHSSSMRSICWWHFHPFQSLKPNWCITKFTRKCQQSSRMDWAKSHVPQFTKNKSMNITTR